MKWHLYKKDDPNTWPKIDCPMVVWTGEDLFLCDWYNDYRKMFDLCEVIDPCFYERLRDLTELYYAYIAYVPSCYKTLYPTRCTKESYCEYGYDDDGYCMAENQQCYFAKLVPEYEIEEKTIWREFEEV